MAFSPRKHPRDQNGKFRRAGLRREPTRSGPTGSTFTRPSAGAVSAATPRKYTNPTPGKYDALFASVPRKPGKYDHLF